MAIDKINPAAAAGAYANTQKGAIAGIGVAGTGSPSFGDLLKNATVDAIDVMRGGEKASANAVIGKADLTDVVEAVTQAETTLQTVIAMRDRMLNAYQEIMRMPI